MEGDFPDVPVSRRGDKEMGYNRTEQHTHYELTVTHELMRCEK